MNTKTQEYTPGQLIRFEATSLYHNAQRLRGIARRSSRDAGFLEEAADAAESSIKLDRKGKFAGINRQERHYEQLADCLETARERLERMPASNEGREAWLLLNRCYYHCITVLSMMEKQALFTGATI